MNKQIKYVLLILIIVGCEQKSKITNIDFSGKSFTVHPSKNSELEEIIEFQDSTFTKLEMSSPYKIQGFTNPFYWNLSYYENIPFLALERLVSGIKKVNDTTYHLYPFNYTTDSTVISLRRPKWNRNMLNGKWIEKQYVLNDKIKNRPELSNKNTEWPPFYEITDSNFVLTAAYPFKSEIVVNNTNEVISLNLLRPFSESAWKIKYVNDSIMIIDKVTQDSTSRELKWVKNIELIKKR